MINTQNKAKIVYNITVINFLLFLLILTISLPTLASNSLNSQQSDSSVEITDEIAIIRSYKQIKTINSSIEDQTRANYGNSLETWGLKYSSGKENFKTSILFSFHNFNSKNRVPLYVKENLEKQVTLNNSNNSNISNSNSQNDLIIVDKQITKEKIILHYYDYAISFDYIIKPFFQYIKPYAGFRSGLLYLKENPRASGTRIIKFDYYLTGYLGLEFIFHKVLFLDIQYGYSWHLENKELMGKNLDLLFGIKY